MHILIISATRMEIQPTLEFLEERNFKVNDNEIEVLTTGIGGISTAYFLTHNISSGHPNYVIQAGIGGSFSTNHPPGSIVLVKEEVIGDLGVEEDDVFKDVFDMGLLDATTQPFTDKLLVNPAFELWLNLHLPFVRSVSVSEITTKASRIEQLQQKYQPVVESMEGAAFHYSCLMQGVPFIQLRAISNYVGERDKSKWKMADAIGLLNDKLIEIIQRDWDFLPNYA